MKKLLFLFFAFYTIANGYSQTSDEYCKSGLSKVEHNDIEGAIADFSKAIELDTNNLFEIYYMTIRN